MQLPSLSHCSSVCTKPSSKFRVSCSQTTPSINQPSHEAHVVHGLKIYGGVDFPVQKIRGEMGRIKEELLKIDLSVSSYDTAWVAMVPSPRFTKSPCFPECIEWILDNQHPDGSWGLPHGYPSLIKDALSSTLACILALRRWNVGEAHVKRGLHYIGSNFSSIMDKNLQSPIGFNIIFPGMIGYAISMGLNLPVCRSDVDAMLSIRDLELERLSGDCSEGEKAYYAYVAEGLSKLLDWQEVMKYQKRNGSLFNSPSTTASVAIHTQDEKALNYLQSLLQKFGNSVPTIYPLDINTQLRIVDNLERFGISRHFSYEIKSILDKIYRCWINNDEEITSDPATCAMAFRSLRMNGYDISSDVLAQFAEVHHFNSLVQGHLRDVGTVLELYKASQIKILPNERILEKIEFWTSCYLKEGFSTDVIRHPKLNEEVDYALKFPFYANLDRLEHKRHIEHFEAKNLQLLKTAYINCSINNKDILNVAVGDFNLSQSIYRKELECLERWDENHEKEFCSKQVEIVFSAFYSTINELGAKASALQKRSVTSHMIEIWLILMKSMMKEAEWLRNESVPTLDEYMENGYVSFALGPIILPALYFVEPKLSEGVIRDLEYHTLFRLVSTCGRLLNDVQGFERERKEGKLNSLSLRILYSGGSISEDDAKRETENIISSTRIELLRLVLQREGSVVPRDCKELFWKTSKVLHLFYLRTDGFTSPKEMMAVVNAVIHEPLKVGHLQLSANS